QLVDRRAVLLDAPGGERRAHRPTHPRVLGRIEVQQRRRPAAAGRRRVAAQAGDAHRVADETRVGEHGARVGVPGDEPAVDPAGQGRPVRRSGRRWHATKRSTTTCRRNGRWEGCEDDAVRRARGELEQDVMTALWTHAEPVTARAVLRTIGDPDLAYTTVKTVLERLTRKGVVTRVN